MSIEETRRWYGGSTRRSKRASWRGCTGWWPRITSTTVLPSFPVGPGLEGLKEAFNVTNGCLALFAAWKAAGKPAEIHVYDGVSAGFGMSTRGLPVDSWNERLLDWLVARNLTRR